MGACGARQGMPHTLEETTYAQKWGDLTLLLIRCDGFRRNAPVDDLVYASGSCPRMVRAVRTALDAR
jgi:hypothetical protein